MKSLEAIRASLSLPATVPGSPDDAPLPVSRDMCDWVRFLALPCQIPFELKALEQPAGAPSRTAPASAMTIGPEGSVVQFHAKFAASGQWLSLDASNVYGLFLPQPKQGFTAAEAAHLIAVVSEIENNSSTMSSWSTWRERQNKWDREQAREARQARLAHINRIRVSEQIRVGAMEAVAAEHAEAFEKHLEAQKVMRALTSDWYPED